MSEEIDPTIKAQFEDALEHVNNLPNQPPKVLLEMYGLYKQAYKGDITGERPGRLEFKARAKYDAWSSRKDLSKEDAMKAYIDLIKSLENRSV